jgi:plasmid stabilization system protein ParE
MQLHFFEEADQELEEQRAWYRERSVSAEAGFLNELDHAIEQVVAAPHQWPRFRFGTRRYVFPKYPFSLIYSLENDAINVVAIAHENRKPGYWRIRLRK